jgi:hypothetical protein
MLRCRPTPPRPRLRAPIRWPCWARRAGRVPAGIAVRCPTACRWRRWRRARSRQGPWAGVGGKQGQQRSDRLGLLRKAAASLTAQQPHLVGEPWRPRSWPSTTAAALVGGSSGGGLAPRWLGTRIGIGHGRLLARPSTAVGTAGRVPRPSSTAGECRTRSRSCLDHADQGVRAVACAHADERAVPTTIQRQGCTTRWR